MAEQTCKDCHGDGSTYADWVHITCRTCDGTGAIHRTGPYRLADGTWSDGVDRSKPINLRQTTDRYEVTTQNGRGMVWLRATIPEPFATWAEAIAYADLMARGGA